VKKSVTRSGRGESAGGDVANGANAPDQGTARVRAFRPVRGAVRRSPGRRPGNGALAPSRPRTSRRPTGAAAVRAGRREQAAGTAPSTSTPDAGAAPAGPPPEGSRQTPPSPAQSRLGLALVLVAAFMAVLDFSIVNVALPSIQRQLGFSPASVQWVVTAYAITFGGLLILGGRTADLFGRRRMLVAGLLVFSAASLAGGLATSPVLLVVARAVQGAGAALIAPASLSILTTTHREGHERNRALGMYGATASVGFVAGLVLGGVLVDIASWRAVFFVNVPVGVAAAALSPVVLPKLADLGRRVRLDPAGALLVTGGITALVYAASQGPLSGWTSGQVLAALGLAALLAAGFLAVERRHPEPLVRLGILRNHDLRWANIVTILLGVWTGGQILVLSFYLQSVQHDSPLVTGVALAPQGVVGFVAGWRGAALTRRLGVGKLLVATTLSATAGLALLTRLPAHGGYPLVAVAICFIGFGNAGTGFATTVAGSSGVANAEQGLAGGLINTSRQIGAALGAAILLALADGTSGVGASGASGARQAMLAAAVVGVLAVIASALGLGRSEARSAPAGATGHAAA
jgi:EmrB/QacA subfamily drug resistance transporter